VLLKALELQGFKSFADKTVLNFDGSITAIVGPNGSGKSNISDAVRWVLGEQSTRSLRGAKMEDVIFGGTEKRSQLGFAEVNLILDNSDGSLNLPASEVSVTRRYYRSGESEYFINRKSARLRDINELFMDTGLGKEGYSNISQGKIDSILALKSTDRRDIFEEAAGISRFRHRKEDAESKLETTESNLLRINDKLSEIMIQLEPLKEQAKKAETYLALSAECKGIEIALWLEELDRISAEAEKLTHDLNSASFILKQNQTDLNNLYEEMEKASVSVLHYDEEIERKRAQLTELAREKAELEKQIGVAATAVEGIRKNISQLQNDLDSQKGRSDSLSDKISAQQAAIAGNLASIEQLEAEKQQLLLENASLTESEAALSAELLRAQQDQQTCKETLIRLDASDAALAERKLQLAEQEIRLADSLDQAKLRLKDEQGRVQELSLQKKEAEQVTQALGNSISGYQLKLKLMNDRLLSQREALDSLKQEIDIRRSRLTALQELEQEYAGFNNSVKYVLQAAEKGVLRNIVGPVSRLVHSEDDVTIAIETAAGGALQNIVVRTEEDGKNAMLFLKKQNAGRATFLPLNNLRTNPIKTHFDEVPGFIGIASELVTFKPEYQTIVDYIFGRTLVFQDLDYSLAFTRKNGNHYHIVTLDGQVINPSGAMTGGSVAKTSGMISRSNEILRLKNELEKLDEKNRSSSAAFEEQEKKQYSLNSELQRLQVQQQEKLQLCASVTASLSGAESAAAACTEAVEKAAADITACHNAVSDCDSQLSTNQKARELCQANASAADRRYSELSEKASESSEQVRAVTTQSNEISAKIAVFRSENEHLNSNISSLQELLDSMSRENSDKNSLIEAYLDSIREREQEAEGYRSELASLSHRESEEQESYNSILAERNAIDAEKTKASSGIRELNETVLGMEREVSRLQQKKTNLELTERQIIDRLWDNYELTRSTAAPFAVPPESKAVGQKRVAELHRKISALGSPNLGAIDDYKRVNERFEYLDSQRQDVEKAKRDLLSVLQDISTEMTAIFTEEFGKIATNFSETFTQMFGGGKATLVLEDPEDPLSCGIDIKVQPPGKQLKTITLLSGGEKAFVAIALYFAILKVRPTPFCILDEIDAALDDSNVGRFASYLANLSDSTQFIVITHRRGTMEESDTLYGVTMQEQGVSRILQLDMDELIERLGISE